MIRAHIINRSTRGGQLRRILLTSKHNWKYRTSWPTSPLLSKLTKKSLACSLDFPTPVPEINISPVPDIVSASWHFVPVIPNLCRSSVYDSLLKFENMPVIVTGTKRILSVTHEIVPDSDRWPAVISCTAFYLLPWFRFIQSNLLVCFKSLIFTVIPR